MICAETKSNTCRQLQSLQYSYITFQYWVGSKHSLSPHIKRSSRLVNDSKEKVINKARSRRSRARLASSSTLAIISQRKATLPLFPESRRRRLTERLAVIRGTMMTRFVPTPTFTLSRGFQGKQKEWTAKTQVPGFCHFMLTFCTLFGPFSQRLWIRLALRKWLQQETFSSLILKGVRGRARKPNSYVAAWATVLATSWATRSCWATRARASKVQLWPPSRTHSAPLLMLFKFSWCSSAKKTCANWIHPRKTNWKK